ncbi:MAG: hypothetical protein NUV47_01205 [Patescibacteria group bacterium]|nr:hypothetical protein [Patescibacteria group bacterium]
MKFAIGIHVNLQKRIYKMENDFSSAKVGDTVWDSQKGSGIIKEININPDNPESGYPIGVKIGNDYINYTIKGYNRKFDTNPSLFWDVIKITPPPKPKRKIEKTIEGWINIYSIESSIGAYLYRTKEEADTHVSCSGNRLGEACYIVHKYTIEE